jgi:Zn-dependent protease
LQDPVPLFLTYLLMMNVSLAIFNLLPFPPLDGGKVLYSILPASMQPILDTLDRFGFLILIVFLWMGIPSLIMQPVVAFVFYLLVLGIR